MLLVVYNKSAGNGYADDAIRKLYDGLSVLGVTYSAIEIGDFSVEKFYGIKRSAAIKRVIICGGDGTVNRAVNVLGEHSDDLIIGVFPGGTGNLIAGALKAAVPLASFVSEDRSPGNCETKVGLANGKIFLNVASVGFTAETVSGVEKFRRTRSGSFIYRVFGGLITHILVFCTAQVQRVFIRDTGHPSSITWLRTGADTSDTSFSVFIGIRETIGRYKSVYLPSSRFIPWDDSGEPVSSREYVIEHKKPFLWQIDGEPQEKTRLLKIVFNRKTIKIATIQQEDE